MPKADIRINVGADTGVSTDILKQDLKNIAQVLSRQKVPQVTVSVNVARTQRQFQTQLQNIVKNLNLTANVNLNPTTGSGSGGGSGKSNKTSVPLSDFKDAEVSTKKMSAATALLTKEKLKLAQATNQEKLNHQQSVNKTKQETEEIKKNIVVSREKIQLLREEKAVQKLVKDPTVKFNTRSNNLERQIRNYLTTNKRLEGTKQGTDLNNILKGFEAGGINEGNINKVSSSFSRVRKEANKAGLEGQNMWDKLTGKYAEYGRFLLVSGSIALLRKSLRDMVQAVKEIDIQMTELKKVTDETDATYKRFLDGAGDRAQKLGATISDVVRSTADFAKMGYSLGEAATLGDVALLYKNVGDGINDISEASGSIISTLKAFKLEASDAMGVVDVFNNISNKYAVTSRDMGLAMADAGAALFTSGNSLEESIALWTAMNEVIQDGSKSSTALRTLSTRMRNTAGKLEEMGEDAEGAAENITQLQQRIQGLTGVNIMASATEFKSTYDVLQDISKVWDNITDKDKADVIRLLGGKNALCVQKCA